MINRAFKEEMKCAKEVGSEGKDRDEKDKQKERKK